MNSSPASSLAVDYHLLGVLDFDQWLGIQRRIAYELGAQPQQRAVVLLCEHPPLITIGRRGSRGHLRLSGQQLRLRGLDVRWVSRGGGCVLHGPGQLSIYVLVSLEVLGWSVAEYVQRLQGGVQRALAATGIASHPGQEDSGLWGRSGQLAAMGIAVRNQVAQHGMFLNVNPPMANYQYVQTATSFTGSSGTRRAMGCLAAERSQSTKMHAIRAALIEHLNHALGSDRHHVLSGHPWIAASRPLPRATDARAS